MSNGTTGWVTSENQLDNFTILTFFTCAWLESIPLFERPQKCARQCGAVSDVEIFWLQPNVYINLNIIILILIVIFWSCNYSGLT